MNLRCFSYFSESLKSPLLILEPHKSCLDSLWGWRFLDGTLYGDTNTKRINRPPLKFSTSTVRGQWGNAKYSNCTFEFSVVFQWLVVLLHSKLDGRCIDVSGPWRLLCESPPHPWQPGREAFTPSGPPSS